MARKAVVTKDGVMDSALAILREEGCENVTARKVAAKAGCSTMPLFHLYENMEELTDILYEKCLTYFEDYYNGYDKDSDTPFVNLGLAYISFASKEKMIFRFLFMSKHRKGRSLYELLNGGTGAVGRELKLAEKDGCKDAGTLFMKMWIFIHGAATMSLTDDFDLSGEETGKLLIDAYRAFVKG